MSHLVSIDAVTHALHKLRSQRTHEFFPGYLYLHKLGAKDGRGIHQPDFAEFYGDFFRVEGGPEGKPYLKPFVSSHASDENLWLNRNIAGSYAPSSLRTGPFTRVVQVGEDRTYNFKENHYDLALQHLLFNCKVDVVSFSLILYRDFPLLREPASILELVSVFRSDFGFSEDDPIASRGFDLLFSCDQQDIGQEPWFTKL